jgi:hypothetical protein
MALRDQPYLPLYIQDIMTDEKLNECCAATHGIYIKGIMCLMHKSHTYGKLLLKQKYKQTENQNKNFASQLVKHLPYLEIEIEEALKELIRENVCFYENDYLCQKRMIRDNEISEARAISGKKGGLKTQEFAKGKIQANTEDEYEDENDVLVKGGVGGNPKKPKAKERNIMYLPLARYLYRIVRLHKNINHTSTEINNWTNDIRLMVENDGITYDRINQVLIWYESHIGLKYTPQAESGDALREKFVKLENAIQRENQPDIINHKPTTSGSHQSGVKITYTKPITKV